MPGIAVFGKLFFKKKRGREKRPSAIPSDTLATACARRLLVVGKIIRRNRGGGANTSSRSMKTRLWRRGANSPSSESGATTLVRPDGMR